ncbi:MAG: hypothetical protein EBS19_05135 [Spirochaetia bacterium]|nr:hypothetical protein [Spirochaetia bacterium]
MRKKKENNKIKFPIQIKGDFELPDFDVTENFSVPKIKNKISSEVKEVAKNKKNKCRSNSLM